MNTASSSDRAYRLLGYFALVHVVALLGLTALLLKSRNEPEWLQRLWVGLVTLSFLWPIVLTLHRGRSIRRCIVIVSLGAILLYPTLRFYNTFAPETFGLPLGVQMDPRSLWVYYSAYRAGEAQAKKDVAAGILVIETYGFGAGGGPEVGRILRERYQIEIKAISGCIVDEIILGHAAGYNSVSEHEIDRRFGKERVEAARAEGYKLANERREREEQYFKDLAHRLSSFSPDSKIILESVQPWVDGRREMSGGDEPALGEFVHAIEKFIADAIPQEISALDLHVSATLTPTEPPRFARLSRMCSLRSC